MLSVSLDEGGSNGPPLGIFPSALLQYLMSAVLAFPFFAPMAGLATFRPGWAVMMSQTIFSILNILTHHGFERQLEICKHLPWPHPLLSFTHHTLNHQVPR
jgi:hypothetical protein